jgi:hypothetical protein
MRRLRVALCLPLLALALPARGAAPVAASGPPNADLGFVQCTATGHLSTNVGITIQTVTFTATLTLSCPGVLDDAGTWSLSLSGQMSPGFCAGGEGLATVNGTGPDSGLFGNLQLAQTGSHIQMQGGWSDSDPAGEEVQIGVEATPTSGVPCVTPQTSENLTGNATITDNTPPPDSVICALSGMENYNPGITAQLVDSAINGFANLSCVNPVSDDQGAWTLDYAGDALADCGVANGQVTITGGGSPEGFAPSGTLSYERVGTMFVLEGDVFTASTDDHSFAAWGAMVPGGNCVTSPWASSSTSADAGMAE